MSENHRGPEVPEARVPVVEYLDGHARITSKDFAPIHSVKSGTRQNSCSTRPREVVELVKSARMHIVRLMNNFVKGPKKNNDKNAVAFFEEYTTIWLRISGYGAAEVFTDFAEELRQMETDPMWKVHEFRCTSR